jgi:hypothetical protein
VSEQLNEAVSSELNTILSGLSLPVKIRTRGLEKNYARELRDLDQLNKQFGESSLAAVCVNINLYVNLLLNAPSLSSALAVVSSVCQRLNINPKDCLTTMGSGLLGLIRNNVEVGSRIDEEINIRRQMDLDTIQQGLVQFFSSCDFSSPNFCSVSDLFMIVKALNVHSRKMCLRSICQNAR